MTKRPEPAHEVDKSNGWEAFAQEFIGRSHLSGVGAAVVEAWADTLPTGARVLDLGCGPGTPRAKVLANKDFDLHAIDAAPSLVNAYRIRFPRVLVACESVEESSFFGETFDGMMAWGLLFLMHADAQRTLFLRVAKALRLGLFCSRRRGKRPRGRMSPRSASQFPSVGTYTEHSLARLASAFGPSTMMKAETTITMR